MKVCLIHDYPIHYKNRLLTAIASRGIDLHVLYLAAGSRIRGERQTPSNAYTHAICYDGNYEESRAASRAAFVWHELSERKPEVVLIHGYYALECWSAWAWARLHGRPRIMWYESNEFDLKRVWWKESIKRIFIGKLTAAHVLGKSSSQYLQRLGLPAERIVIKGPIVDPNRFRTTPEEKSYSASGNKRFLFIGRLATEKNIPFLIDAFAALVRNEAHRHSRLTLIGIGPLQQQIESQISELGLSGSVEIKGWLSTEELLSTVRLHDFLVLPSTYEPYGLVALEAMASSLPIILSTRCGATADLVKPTTGWCFSPFEKSELVNVLKNASQLSQAENELMGAAAFTESIKFSPEAAAETVVSHLRRIEGRQPTEKIPQTLNDGIDGHRASNQ